MFAKQTKLNGKGAWMLRIFAFILIAALTIAILPAAVYAAEEQEQEQEQEQEEEAANHFYTMEEFQRYYNAIMLSSASRGISDYALGEILAELGDDGYYRFSYSFPNGSFMQGTVDMDGKIYETSLTVMTGTNDDAVFGKYMIFASVAATQFKDIAAVDKTSEILKNINIETENYRFPDTTSISYTKSYIVYSLTTDSNGGTATLSMTSAL